MRARIAIAVVAGITFLVGLLAGDYAAGQVSATVFGLSAVGAALVPIGGTLAQIYADKSRGDEATLREKREAHAQRLVEECLVPLCSVGFFGRDGELWMAKSTFLPLAIDLGAQGGQRYVQGLRFWKYAVEHIREGTNLAPGWGELERLADRWNDEKYEVDRKFLVKAKAFVKEELGEGFAISPDWLDPPPAKWFNAGRLAEWTRRGLMDFGVTTSTVDFPAGPGREKRTQTVVQSGPYRFFGADKATLVPEGKCVAVYRRLLTDTELVSGLEGLRATESQIRSYLPTFLDSAWDFCQEVEASLLLPGKCDVCKGFAT